MTAGAFVVYASADERDLIFQVADADGVPVAPDQLALKAEVETAAAQLSVSVRLGRGDGGVWAPYVRAHALLSPVA